MSNFDHKTILSNLSADERKFFTEQSDAPGLSHFTIHLGAIAICTMLIVMNAPFLPAIMMVQGIFICFLFTILHETVHRTAFRSDALNIWVGRICGFLIFLGPEWFRHFHLAHHRFTQNPNRDPELTIPKPSTSWQYLKYLSGIPEWFDRISILIRNATQVNQDSFVTQQGKSKVMAGAQIQLALYAGLLMLSILLWSPLAAFIWLFPILLGGPFLRAYLLAEHGRCPHVASMLENTRTTFTNKFVRFLAWNMPYHVEHHTYPTVPFHKLPDFHKYIRKHIKYHESGYLRFNHAYFRDSISGKLANEAAQET